MALVQRHLTKCVKKALLNAPLVYINGPRQAGKSTLCRSLVEDFNYFTFDRMSTHAAAKDDPTGFIARLPSRTILDEIQLVPEIFRPLKYHIDELRLSSAAPITGLFILTGSANILAIPSLADSLVGRMQVLTLLPFSAAEAFDGNIDFISDLFEKEPKMQTLTARYSLSEVIQKATFPEISLMLHNGKTSIEQRESAVIWYENYISNIINRDIRALSDVEKITDLPRMLTLLANRVGNLLSHASFSRDVGLVVSTYKRYLTLFQHVYLVTLVEPWFRNVTKRLTKSPKVYLTDTALLMALLGRASIDDYAMKGAVLENFVASELTKHINCLHGFKLFHFRTSDDKEVDFVIERTDGKLIGIEVKYASSVTKSDFNGLKVLKDVAGDDFIRGVVLYQGDEILPFGDRLYAMPLSCLWGG